jgi:tetratricopeptide (TPR) repeat protein
MAWRQGPWPNCCQVSFSDHWALAYLQFVQLFRHLLSRDTDIQMRLPRSLFPAMLALLAALALAGCESAEEKAERYYLSGMELLAAGDEERALVEFRNVFKYNGFHKEARKTYADTVLKQGNVQEAYSQYLRLIEQYPDTPEVRLVLAELAISRGDWTEAERHGSEAVRLAPDAPGVPAVKLALAYRKAVLDRDETARAALGEEARAILEKTPDSRIALRILIDQLASGPDPKAAIPEIDRALALEPEALELYVAKLRILAESGDSAGTGALLKTMVERFPDNVEARSALIAWYMSESDIDGAEAFMRKLAGDPTGPVEGHVAVVQLLQATRGAEAAKTELGKLIIANDGTANADLYRALDATFDFEAGKHDKAIAAIEAVLKAADTSDQTRRIKVMLAKMLEATGNSVGARARIEEVLAEDATNVEALKMRAGWLIQEDRPGEAIVDLRAALGQAPRDAAILTLMAAAHERDGSLELAGERLALAVEVSGSAPDESMRYAQFLLKQGRTQAADKVLTDARRVSPAHVGVLAMLADLALNAKDWSRTQEIADTLSKISTPDAETAAKALKAALLLGQDRTEEGLAFLEEQVGKGGDDLAAIQMILQAKIRSGKPEEARAYLDSELAKRPDNPGLRLLSAGLHALMGEVPQAEALFRALIAEDPTAELPARLLYGLLSSDGRAEEAAEVLKAALAAQPDTASLLWIKAGELEKAGDIDGAIAVYEALYAKDSSNAIIANNLASLITTHRDDPDSLARATAIVRRLKGTELPAFQDTYGWIAHRNGNHDEALTYLEPAAAGLPNDPVVQFHLGMTYLALGRVEDARRQLTRALELAGDSPLPQFETARQTLAGLPAAPSP